MSAKTYKIQEIFHSVQGEGLRAGTANIFIRFTGCNLRCAVAPGKLSPGGFDCDTEFMSGRDMTATEMLAFCDKIAPKANAVIFTGGEPTLQLTEELIATFKASGFYTAIETNGSKTVPPGLDWVTVSPKVSEHSIKQLTASEVKYVRHLGQGIPKPAVKADYYVLSPAFDGGELDQETLAWCIKLVKENPTWRLSVQQHKSWKVR